MNFTVIWLPDALNGLADIWMNAADQSAVTQASHRLDQRLASDPLNEAESRGGDDRITFEPPLQILFSVAAATRIVHVTAVGLSRRP